MDPSPDPTSGPVNRQETVRAIYDLDDPTVAGEFVARLGQDLQDDDCPPEVRQLGRTIVRWRDQIAAWHHAHVSNGPTEAVILWSGHGDVVDVADGAGRARRGRVLWSLSPMFMTCS